MRHLNRSPRCCAVSTCNLPVVEVHESGTLGAFAVVQGIDADARGTLRCAAVCEDPLWVGVILDHFDDVPERVHGLVHTFPGGVGAADLLRERSRRYVRWVPLDAPRKAALGWQVPRHVWRLGSSFHLERELSVLRGGWLVGAHFGLVLSDPEVSLVKGRVTPHVLIQSIQTLSQEVGLRVRELQQRAQVSDELVRKRFDDETNDAVVEAERRRVVCLEHLSMGCCKGTILVSKLNK